MDLGLLQREAAHRLRVCLATYRLWEWDEVSLRVQAMGRVVAFLGSDPTPQPEGFPGRLASARRRLGLTQAEFATKLGVDASTPSHWEQGVTTPRAGYWPRIVALLGEDPSPAPTTTGERFLALRRRLGLSQRQLAQRLELRAASLSFWECGGEPSRERRDEVERLLARNGV